MVLTGCFSAQQVLELEGEKGEWGFKALKQMIKINFKLVSRPAVESSTLILKMFNVTMETCLPGWYEKADLNTAVLDSDRVPHCALLACMPCSPSSTAAFSDKLP